MRKAGGDFRRHARGKGIDVKAKGVTAPRALPARLEDLPNVGPAVAADFRRLGIGTPDEIRNNEQVAMTLLGTSGPEAFTRGSLH